jgi:hypothetical protein
MLSRDKSRSYRIIQVEIGTGGGHPCSQETEVLVATESCRDWNRRRPSMLPGDRSSSYKIIQVEIGTGRGHQFF